MLKKAGWILLGLMLAALALLVSAPTLS